MQILLCLQDLLCPLSLLFEVLHYNVRILEIGCLSPRFFPGVDLVVRHRHPFLNLLHFWFVCPLWYQISLPSSSDGFLAFLMLHVGYLLQLLWEFRILVQQVVVNLNSRRTWQGQPCSVEDTTIAWDSISFVAWRAWLLFPEVNFTLRKNQSCAFIVDLNLRDLLLFLWVLVQNL